MLRRLNFARDQGPLMALARQMHAEGVYAGFPLNEGRTLYIMEQLIGHPEHEVYAHGWFDKHLHSAVLARRSRRRRFDPGLRGMGRGSRG